MILCLLGQTAIGKSCLSLKLAKALKTDIISADSMQIYKGFDIGTAKPSLSERQEVVHHMIDIAQPCDYFSSSDYAEKAEICISDANKKGKIPFLSGGTGFYFDSVIFPNDFDNSVDLNFRSEIKQFYEENGKVALHKMLEKVDPQSASEIHSNNVKQIMRAIEIYVTTGKRKSEGNKIREPKYKDCVIFQMTMPRVKLYERIEKRVDEMISIGLLSEVEKLYGEVDKSCQSMQGIGYKEIVAYLEKKCTLEDAIALIKQNTRNYAKRQETYFKRMNTIKLDAEKGDEFNLDLILSILEQKGDL